MSASEILRKAKGLIDSPEKWHHGPQARGSKGERCIGCALTKAFGSEISFVSAEIQPLFKLFDAANGWSAGTAGMGLINFNEHPSTTHADVMAAFDRAIALAEKDELKVRESDADYARRMVASIVATVPDGALKHESASAK